MQLLRNKVHDGNLSIKLDNSKTFDTLRWDYIIQVLRSFGFSNNFFSLDSHFLRSAKLSILVNGSLRGFFWCLQGVRQGNPLPPLLFVFAEDVLIRGLTQLFDTDWIRGISHPNGCSLPTHVLYVDDIFVFCHVDPNSLSRLLQQLENYGCAFGQ